MHRRALLLAIGSSALLGRQGGAAPAPLIAAAASLQPVLEEAAGLIAAETGIAPRLAYGASGNLARQILQGAPFEMLLAADEISIQKLAEAGHTRDAGHVFAVGRLALFAPRGSALDPAAGLEALRPLLAAGRVQRFAMAPRSMRTVRYSWPLTRSTRKSLAPAVAMSWAAISSPRRRNSP